MQKKRKEVPNTQPWTSEHTKWLIDTGERLKTADGKEVEVWEFRHEKDEAVLSAWAKHFRNHYCFDSEIDYWRRGYKCSRGEYLNTIKFPDPKDAPGPSIRAGDFGEVLVADFLEYLLGYWVPRTRYGDKTIRNESTKGSDIIGFHIVKDGKAGSSQQKYRKSIDAAAAGVTQRRLRDCRRLRSDQGA